MPEYIYTDTCSNVDISHVTYDVVSYSDIGSSNIHRDKLGLPVRRILKATNRIISFTYAVYDAKNKSISDFVGTVNSKPVNIGGLIFEKNTAKLLEISATPIKDSFSKIRFQIEIADQKDVYKTVIPKEGFYFKHPNVNKYVRAQISSSPELYLNKPEYPNSINVYNGLGFYTEDRPDLNIVEPIPLDTNDYINLSDKLVYIEEEDAKPINWAFLGIPKKGLI